MAFTLDTTQAFGRVERDMSLPYTRHLEWLTLEGLDDKAIQSFYDGIQLPLPTGDDIQKAHEKTRSLIIPPAVKRNLMKRKYLASDTPVWEKLGYGELHARRVRDRVSAEWEMVGRLLNHPVMRTALDCLLVARYPLERICVLLPQVYGLPLSEAGIGLYQKYFANFEHFQRGDWSAYLDRVREDHYVYVRMFTALTRPVDEVLHLCSLPTEKQFTDFLRNVLAAADYKFKYYLRSNTSEADVHARRWAKVGFEAGERIEKYGASDMTDFAKLVQTEFEYISGEVPVAGADLVSMRPDLKEDQKALPEAKSGTAATSENNPPQQNLGV